MDVLVEFTVLGLGILMILVPTAIVAWFITALMHWNHERKQPRRQRGFK